MIKIAQDIEVSGSSQDVWDFLMDVDQVAACMPGVESVEPAGDDTYQVQLSLRVGPIKPKFRGEVAFLEKKPTESMRVRLDWTDVVTKSKAKSEAEISLEEASDDRIIIHVNADVDVLGALSKYGQGVANKKATEIAETFGEEMRNRLKANA